MKILFTGASSFTGMHFVKELVENGHEVICPLLRPEKAYIGIRKERIELLRGWCHLQFDCPFGSDSFFQLIEKPASWDVFCHHAADVTNYKSPSFDFIGALSKNTHRLPEILSNHKFGCVVLTGSVFEQDEGKGTDGLRAVSPYGLSKGLTSETFKYFCKMHDTPLSKFVIPNPFGPYEEKRFSTYLIQSWVKGEIAKIKSPNYIRDNVPVSLLSKAYTKFVEETYTAPLSFRKINPSFYVEKQSQFTERMAREVKSRLPLTCEYQLCEQISFPEPKNRINLDPLNPKNYSWNEKRAWDNYIEYFQSHYLEVQTRP